MANQMLAVVHEAIQRSWCAETACGEWTTTNPPLNQCAVTALIIQDYFGGKLLRCPMPDGGSHYWNLLDNNMEVDLTVAQFNQIDAKPIKDKKVTRSRKYVLSFPHTARRYRILQRRVDDMIAQLLITHWERG